jgi:RNA polymerase subunit RPABC4/transcription elongation factor Spt4
MTCKYCGRYSEPDRETGYDASDICPECEREREDCAADDAADDWRDLLNFIENDDM